MARQPIVSEQLFKKVKVLLKRTSRRVSPGRRAQRAAGVVSSSPTKKAKPIRIKSSVTNPVSKSKHASADRKGSSAKSGAFWSNLVWVRPWLLVVALWLTFILMIAIALAGLSSPGREMVLEPVNSGLVGQPLSTPDAAAVSRLIPRDAGVSARHDPAATLPGATEQSMPAWPLLVMVAACAGGCMLMSQPSVLTPDSRRGRRRVPQSSEPRKIVARPAVAKPNKRQRRKQRRFGGKRPTAMGLRVGYKVRPTPIRANSGISSQPASFKVKAETVTSVTVVPDQETSPLDWKDGSLAHKLDVRQTRSVNSFL